MLHSDSVFYVISFAASAILPHISVAVCVPFTLLLLLMMMVVVVTVCRLCLCVTWMHETVSLLS